LNGSYLSVSVGDPASEVLKDGCQDLMLMCKHVRSTFGKAVNDFKTSKSVRSTSEKAVKTSKSVGSSSEKSVSESDDDMDE
jgi:DNA-directed RNA polymerases I and III subunit RPAC2